jgi:hypothetical protein
MRRFLCKGIYHSILSALFVNNTVADEIAAQEFGIAVATVYGGVFRTMIS